jgi:hypothetical protein
LKKWEGMEMEVERDVGEERRGGERLVIEGVNV